MRRAITVVSLVILMALLLLEGPQGLLSHINAFAASTYDTLEFITYYPSTWGEYRTLQVGNATTNGSLTMDGPAVLNSYTDPDTGNMGQKAEATALLNIGGAQEYGGSFAGYNGSATIYGDLTLGELGHGSFGWLDRADLIVHGNVGIGTADPEAKLQVSDSTNSTGVLTINEHGQFYGAYTLVPYSEFMSFWANITYPVGMYYYSVPPANDGFPVTGVVNTIKSRTRNIFGVCNLLVDENLSFVYPTAATGIENYIRTMSSYARGEFTNIEAFNTATDQNIHGNEIIVSPDSTGDTAYGIYVVLSSAGFSPIDIADPTNDMIALYVGNKITGSDVNNKKFAVYSAQGKNYFADSVGIGTTAPAAKLQVDSNSGLEGDMYYGMRVKDPFTSYTAMPRTGIVFNTLNRDGGGWDFGGIQGGKENTNNDVHYGYLSLHTSDGPWGSLSEKMRITSAGKVGIGTTGPTQRLQLGGGSWIGIPSVSSWSNVPTSWQRGGGGIIMATSQNADGTGWAYGSRLVTVDYGDGLGTSFDVLTWGTWTNDALFISGRSGRIGNVGIGTTNPQGTLDVNGTIYQRGAERHADYVFEPEYELESIEAHSSFMWNNKHLPALQKIEKADDGTYTVELGSTQNGILEELEKAHIYIAELNDEIKDLKSEMQSLKKLKER